MEVYISMAHFVAKELNQRPSDILDGWSVPELIVAFGQYANERSMENYETWKSAGSEQRKSIPMPNKYTVYFENI